MEMERVFWQQESAAGNMVVEAITVQGHPGYWIRTVTPLKGAGLAATLWVNWGERVYRYRLHCRPGKCGDGEQQLRQVLSTLTVIPEDWGRVAELLAVQPGNVASNTSPTIMPQSNTATTSSFSVICR
jgi:hypothetical protein